VSRNDFRLRKLGEFSPSILAGLIIADFLLKYKNQFRKVKLFLVISDNKF